MKRELPVQRVVLHGSAACGELTEASDLDLIVIGDFHGRMPERIGLVLDRVPPGLPIEPLCYTPAEVRQLLADNSPFLTRALASGVEVGGDQQFRLESPLEKYHARRTAADSPAQTSNPLEPKTQ